MDWLQINDYMIIVEKEKTTKYYQNLHVEQNNQYELFMELTRNDEQFADFLQQFGVTQIKPLCLNSLSVEQGKAMMFTGKYYFEGYLELGDYDLWDMFVGDAVCSFTNEDKAPFLDNETSYVEISFEIIKEMN